MIPAAGAIIALAAAPTDRPQAAVKYVNAELGRKGGHPIEPRTCFIAPARVTSGSALVTVCPEAARNQRRV